MYVRTYVRTYIFLLLNLVRTTAHLGRDAARRGAWPIPSLVVAFDQEDNNGNAEFSEGAPPTHACDIYAPGLRVSCA